MFDSLLPFAGNRAAFRFRVDGLDHDLRVLRFTASEGISRLYEVQLELVAAEASLSLERVRHRAAALALASPAGPRYIHGLLRRFEFVEARRRFSIYRTTLVPRAWLLGQRHDCRIFQHRTTQEIVAEVLRGVGVAGDEVRFALGDTYGPRAYCTQYRETDLDFIRRLMEEDGMFFFFEHDHDRHVLVVADDAGVHPPIPGDAAAQTLAFRPASGTRQLTERITALSVAEVVRTGKTSVRNFDFTRPDSDMDISLASATDPDLESYDYPSNCPSVRPDLVGAGALLGARLQALQAGLTAVRGASDSVRLVPGHAMTVAGHDHPQLAARQLVTRAHHHGHQPQVLEEESEGEFTYDCQFEAQPLAVPYRSPRDTPRPAIHGLQTAIVVGPTGDEIHVDEHGRVKVQFHWDRQGARDERSSCWLRVGQPWAGPGFGVQMLPRVGHEVIVAFLEGDPDRPLILGSVYNGNNPTPHRLPADRTRTAIRTRSTPGGEGFNELRFDDEKHAEQLLVRAERDADVHIGHDRREHVGRDAHRAVDRDSVEATGRDSHLSVRRHSHTRVGGDLDLEVGGQDGEGRVDIRVHSDLHADLGGDSHLHIAGALQLAVADASNVSVGGLRLASAGPLQIRSTGDTQIVTTSTLVLEATSGLTLRVGSSHITLTPGNIAIVGAQILLNSGGSPFNAADTPPPAAPVPPAITTPRAPDPADDGT